MLLRYPLGGRSTTAFAKCAVQIGTYIGALDLFFQQRLSASRCGHAVTSRSCKVVTRNRVFIGKATEQDLKRGASKWSRGLKPLGSLPFG
jgi:hypothetical protein